MSDILETLGRASYWAGSGACCQSLTTSQGLSRLVSAAAVMAATPALRATSAATCALGVHCLDGFLVALHCSAWPGRVDQGCSARSTGLTNARHKPVGLAPSLQSGLTASSAPSYGLGSVFVEPGMALRTVSLWVPPNAMLSPWATGRTSFHDEKVS